MGVLSPLLYPGYKEWDRGLAGHLLIGWGTYAYWVGGRIRQNTSSLWGRRGDSLYCSINSYSGGGKDDKGLVSPFLHSKTLLGYLLFCPWVTTFVPLSIFRANSLAPFDTLLMSSCLPISLLSHLGTRSQGKRGHDHSGFFRLYRGVMGLWVPFTCSLSGYIYGGRWESIKW